MEDKIRRRRVTEIGAALLVALFALAACSNSNNNDAPSAPLKPKAENPLVEGPVTGGGSDDCCVLVGGLVDLRDEGYMPGTPFYSGLSYDESELDYRETEFFISGTAHSYIGTDELGDDGVWFVQTADAAEFRSRIVVQRPVDPEKFNGTVVVEWFNVSGGLDASPDFLAMHTELVREGYVWVGVSAQSAGVEGGGGAFDISLKVVDSERYGRLSHPGDSFSYDIFSQAAQAVRNPVGLDPLEGLKVERMVAVGQSQSAFRLVTYYNAVHPTIDLFDGFIIHSRSGSGASISQAPQVEVPVPEVVFIRTDLPEPVITLQSETDIFRLNSVVARQADSDKFRLWEVAGTAHSDIYTTLKSPGDRGHNPKVVDVIPEPQVRPPFITCDFPANDGPMHFVAKAALHAIDNWIRNNQAAPSAPLLSTDEAGTAFTHDNLGNVEGGVRTPYVDAPVAVLHGEGQPPADVFCGLFGTTAQFDKAQLSELYPSKDVYVNAIDTATDSAVDAGFLLPADALLIKARAKTSPLPAAQPSAGD